MKSTGPFRAMVPRRCTIVYAGKTNTCESFRLLMFSAGRTYTPVSLQKFPSAHWRVIYCLHQNVLHGGLVGVRRTRRAEGCSFFLHVSGLLLAPFPLRVCVCPHFRFGFVWRRVSRSLLLLALHRELTTGWQAFGVWAAHQDWQGRLGAHIFLSRSSLMHMGKSLDWYLMKDLYPLFRL